MIQWNIVEYGLMRSQYIAKNRGIKLMTWWRIYLIQFGTGGVNKFVANIQSMDNKHKHTHEHIRSLSLHLFIYFFILSYHIQRHTNRVDMFVLMPCSWCFFHYINNRLNVKKSKRCGFFLCIVMETITNENRNSQPTQSTTSQFDKIIIE